MSRQPPPQLIEEVQQFLDRLTKAVTSGDGRAVAALWEAPALLLRDDRTLSFASAAQMEELFSGSKARYNSRGIVDTRGEIEGLEPVSPGMLLVNVRFPRLDAQGREVGVDRWTYTLRRDENEELRLRVAIMHTATMDVDRFKASLTADSPPAELSVPLAALWWDAKGDWSRAHDMVNALETKDGMAVHAYLHRKEGDASNARYWYQRAGRGFHRPKLTDEWNALVEGLLK